MIIKRRTVVEEQPVRGLSCAGARREPSDGAVPALAQVRKRFSGPATSAELVNPSSVAITSTGNLVIADQDNENENISRVRSVQG